MDIKFQTLGYVQEELLKILGEIWLGLSAWYEFTKDKILEQIVI